MSAFWTTLLAVLGSLAASLLVARSSRKATEATVRAANATAREADRTENRRVDGEAYERAQKINQDIVNGLTEALKRVEVELSACRAELTTAKAAKAELHAATERMTTANLQLLSLLEQCKDLLEQNHLPVPEGVQVLRRPA